MLAAARDSIVALIAVDVLKSELRAGLYPVCEALLSPVRKSPRCLRHCCQDSLRCPLHLQSTSPPHRVQDNGDVRCKQHSGAWAHAWGVTVVQPMGAHRPFKGL
eukprot:gnl/TRDRNA2_/TRDRNA2_158375_c0_seq3.p2 gnl/TRDRNA2_/TRDRNA2_158375_c0~~gnl/TRDRNA2_/TRDRNA2_158375_c0_seq3.p2  ORF type:complete len:104 (+),score=2.65 gnl/TRDRNA2_/TRDRNA2_158375_c0_seq3:77-388(+)